MALITEITHRLRRLYTLTCVLMCIVFIYASSAHAAPVWKVTKGEHTLYVGGTVHLLTQADYPLPAEFERAYSNATTLVLETDMGVMESMAFQQKMMQAMSYKNGKTIEHDLSVSTLKRLKAHLASRGIPYEAFKRFKAGMLSMTLTVVELQRLGLSGEGVDAFYYKKAVTDGKRNDYLEQPDEQIAFLANMGQGAEDEMINYTLDDVAKLPTMMRDLKAAWRAGDNKALAKIGLTPWQDKFPNLFKQIILERNNNWIPQIERMLQTPDVEVVLVGALHLVGDFGVLSQLEQRGYLVTKL